MASCNYYVDGAVYAQSLYAPAVAILGRTSHGVAYSTKVNILYVATMNDKVYAFDADRPGPPLWERDFTDELNGIVPAPVADITNRPDLNVVGNVGILGTPVIDPAAHAIFCVVRTRESGLTCSGFGSSIWRRGNDLHAPAVIEASVRSSYQDAVDGLLHFDPKVGNQRAGLVLVNGSVVIAWASHEDIEPYSHCMGRHH